jgi:hypothetical protein
MKKGNLVTATEPGRDVAVFPLTHRVLLAFLCRAAPRLTGTPHKLKHASPADDDELKCWQLLARCDGQCGTRCVSHAVHTTLPQHATQHLKPTNVVL